MKYHFTHHIVDDLEVEARNYKKAEEKILSNNWKGVEKDIIQAEIYNEKGDLVYDSGLL